MRISYIKKKLQKDLTSKPLKCERDVNLIFLLLLFFKLNEKILERKKLY